MVSINDILMKLDEEDIQYDFYGDSNSYIEGFSSLNNYKENTVTWCKDVNYLEDVNLERIQLIISPEMYKYKFKNCIVVNNPKRIFFAVIEAFFYIEENVQELENSSFIADNVRIGKNVKIGKNCVIEGDIVIGDNTIIYNNVNIINKVTIGNNCTIQTGTIIGHDDFAYTEDDYHRKKMIKHYGGVCIGNDVYFGPACIVNRGTIDDTVIGDGCKIDARCIVSHNVNLGKNSTLIAGSILHGSVKTGNNVYVASAIIKNQLYLGENAFVGLGSVVTKDVEENTTVAGIPAKPLYR